MKQLFLMIVVCIITLSVNAQSQTGITTFNKSPQSSVIYNLPYSEEAVANAVENKMNSYGKPKKVKGFMMYKNVFISEISDQPLTLYFTTEKKSKRDNNNAVLTMMIADGADKFFTTEENPELFTKAKIYLDSFEKAVAAASLELNIKDQDDAVKKADKKLKNLRDDGIDYEKQKKKLEAKIAENITDVANQEKEAAKQKEQLDALIKQRKN